MSLIGALNIGKTALSAQQAALQVTGNNIANAGNADFTRQVTSMSPVKDQQIQPGIFMGAGVDLTGIQRQIDEALQGRLRNSASDAESADTTQQWLGRVEAVFNELGDEDLSTQMSKFFNGWSDLANKPQDIGLRQVVLQNGDSLAKQMQSVRKSLGDLQNDVDSRLTALTNNADQLAEQVAKLNGQIVTAEGGSGAGGGSANALRDQRDAVLGQLSKLMNIKTVADGGVINVYVGSAPLVMAAQNRGVALRQDNLAGKLTSTVIFKADNSAIDVGASGQIGALSDLRANQIGAAMDKVDTLAGNLIFSLNKVYSSGQGLRGFSTVTATNQVDDPTVALNDPTANLAFKPVNGSFVVHVKAKGANITTSTLVQVDLDGLNGNDTTLNSLAASLNSIPDISASVIGGKLQINGGSPDIDLSFSQDSSGVLASLGINSFFTGTTARDIAVNSIVQANPVLLAASKNSEPGDNQTALAIAGLESQPVEALNGASLKDNYQSIINGIAVSAASAKTNAEATKAVQDTLSAQRESLSGVSLDEEAVNLMRQQRAFQGAARLISAVDEMMKTLLSM